MKKIIGMFLFIVGLFSACSKVSDKDLVQARKAVKNGALIVDVRTPEEFKVKHVSGSINLPIQEIRKGNIQLPKDKEIVVYCRAGKRSKMSAKILREQGWIVYDVATQAEWKRKIKLNNHLFPR